MSQHDEEADVVSDIESTALLSAPQRTPERHLELDRYRVLNSKEKEKMAKGWATRLMKAGVGFILVIGCIIVVILTLNYRQKTTLPPADVKCDARLAPQHGDLVFYVVGDWGRANDNQMRAVKLMDEVAACLPPSVIISTGDNIYPSGLFSSDDPQFMDKFFCPYSTVSCNSPAGTQYANIRGIQWHAVLGNHDYGDNMPDDYIERCKGKMGGKAVDTCDPECCASPLHQMAENNKNVNPSVWDLRSSAHRVSLSNDVDLILVDTNPFISRYHEASWANVIGGISSQNTTLIKEQVEAALSASKASLKILVGHSPIKSKGEHCTQGPDCTETSAWLSPLITKYGVKVYFSGHDHDLQHTVEDGVHYVVSGAGSDVRDGEFDPKDDESFWGRDDQGFVGVRVRKGGDATMMFFTSTEGLAFQVDVPRL